MKRTKYFADRGKEKGFGVEYDYWIKTEMAYNLNRIADSLEKISKKIK